MRRFEELFEKYSIGRQLDELMPAYIKEDMDMLDTECFECISLNESEEKLPTKYPVKDAPKVKGWFGLISVKYMMKVRAIRKLCIQYINSYVESSLNVAKNLDKVKMFKKMKNLATELAMSYDDKKNSERSVNTKSGLAFLSGDKALQDKLEAILAQIDTHAQKSEQLKQWADLMKLKSKEIACNVVYHETRDIIEKEANAEEKNQLKELDNEFVEAGKGAEEALAEGAEKTKKNKEIHDLKEEFKKKLKDKTGDDVPQELRGKNGKYSAQKFNKLAKTDNGLKQLQNLAKTLKESMGYVITSFDAFNESLMNKMDYAVIEVQHFDDIEKRWCVDVWKTHNQMEEGKTVAYVYEDGDVEFIDPEAEQSRQVHQEIINFLKTQYKWYTSGKKFNESYIPIRGKVVTDGELRRAIAQAAKYDNGTQKVYAEDISAEPVILDSSVIRGMKWAVLEIELNDGQIGVRVMPYRGKMRDGHYVEREYDVLPLEAFTDESVNRLYDIIERYNDR